MAGEVYPHKRSNWDIVIPAKAGMTPRTSMSAAGLKLMTLNAKLGKSPASILFQVSNLFG